MVRLAALVVTFSAAVAACGGRVVDDAHAGDGGDLRDASVVADAGSDTCPRGGCNDATPTAPPCPAAPPQTDSACPISGQVCKSWGSDCSLSCTCAAHQWKCDDPCPLCPPPPPNGTSCYGKVGMVCKYDIGCKGFMQCDCVATTNSASWLCGAVDCDGGRD